MSLFNMFKRPPKKETAQTSQKETSSPSTQDDSLLSPAMEKKRYDAAMEFVEALKEKTPLVNGVPHAGTVLAVPARLAGSSLYRSLNAG